MLQSFYDRAHRALMLLAGNLLSTSHYQSWKWDKKGSFPIMARSSTQSWAALEEIIRDYLDKPCTTGEIAKWVETPTAFALGVEISKATVYRLLKDTTTAGIYGLTKVNNRWVYSEKAREKTKKEFVKAAGVNTNLDIQDEAAKEAARMAELTKALSGQGIERLSETLNELTQQKRAFAQDEYEEKILLRFRELCIEYGDDEMIPKAIDYYTNHYTGTVESFASNIKDVEPHKVPLQLMLSALSKFKHEGEN